MRKTLSNTEKLDIVCCVDAVLLLCILQVGCGQQAAASGHHMDIPTMHLPGALWDYSTSKQVSKSVKCPILLRQ